MRPEKMLLFLELNEVNFEFVEAYVARGHLPNFESFFSQHGFAETSSESDYDELEPWIQWVTAHTGMPLAEHGIFRLGDITRADIEQIWERLSAHGLKVGAISPMNAKCRADDAAFFVPDPWTETPVIADPVVKRMFAAIVQAVNDNAQAYVKPRSLFDLAVGAAVTALPSHYGRYLHYVAQARARPWIKAIFLDQLLADLFTKSVRKHRPNFATLFVNAAAHIQHHYMFSSAVYDGTMKNPDGYVASGQDPLLDVYQAYDRILGDIVSQFPDARIMLATGLHQDPHPGLTYYWRIRDHAQFLRKLGLQFESVEARMSRDFLITCKDATEALTMESSLNSASAADGVKLFEVDNRGVDLFVMLTYPMNIDAKTEFSMGGRIFTNLVDDVAFVAIKNGQHNGIGYFSDNRTTVNLRGERFPLAEMPDKIMAAFDLSRSRETSRVAA